ncbi:hypothetical protein EX30DRAFT_341198 [Ascodesmis nigricans]|uniref:Uncharacterized protein n=1 Tax=Ascodesmis nigricans TaxID=341454 RepID=A0A4S2MW75_9PEZI|nr:hypothetical protein EX30DRAFT_341198 [Ascodesmis nigricans]
MFEAYLTVNHPQTQHHDNPRLNPHPRSLHTIRGAQCESAPQFEHIHPPPKHGAVHLPRTRTSNPSLESISPSIPHGTTLQSHSRPHPPSISFHS